MDIITIGLIFANIYTNFKDTITKNIFGCCSRISKEIDKNIKELKQPDE